MERRVGFQRSTATHGQPSLQLFPVTPAHPEFGSIVESHLVFTILAQLQPLDSIEIDYSRTVNTAKDGLIQLLIEFGKATAQQVCFRFYVQTHVVVRSFNPIDV